VRLIGIIVSALLLATAARADAPAPEQTVRAFYSWVLAHPSRGLPSSKERALLTSFLSPQLVQLLKEAADTQARCVKASPKGEKPNIIEGDLFVGNYEGATEVAYGNAEREGEIVVVESKLFYLDPRFPKAHRHRAIAWTDRLQLRLTGIRWLVQDVTFQPDRSLAEGLREYITEGARSCVTP
jgi:hypothetical protein